MPIDLKTLANCTKQNKSVFCHVQVLKMMGGGGGNVGLSGFINVIRNSLMSYVTSSVGKQQIKIE